MEQGKNEDKIGEQEKVMTFVFPDEKLLSSETT